MRIKITAVGLASATLSGIVLSACSSAPAPPEAISSESQEPTPGAAAAEESRYQVRISASRQRQYALPTLAAFEASPAVLGHVVGRVTSAEAQVAGDGSDTVFTMTTVEVQHSTVPGLQGQTIRVRESGGVVEVRDIRKTFESKLERTLTEKELAQTVDHQVEGEQHTQAGDVVTFWLSDPADAIVEKRFLDAAARMRLDPATSTFHWYGQPPNERWQKQISWDEAVTPVR